MLETTACWAADLPNAIPVPKITLLEPVLSASSSAQARQV
jgi:hypothetical protein